MSPTDLPSNDVPAVRHSGLGGRLHREPVGRDDLFHLVTDPDQIAEGTKRAADAIRALIETPDSDQS